MGCCARGRHSVDKSLGEVLVQYGGITVRKDRQASTGVEGNGRMGKGHRSLSYRMKRMGRDEGWEDRKEDGNSGWMDKKAVSKKC